MEHDINPAESPARLVSDLHTPMVTRRRTPLTRLLDLLAVRPGLARVLSDGLLLLALCGGGLGAVAYYQHAAATRPAPLAGMAELHAQIIEVPPTPALPYAVTEGKAPPSTAAPSAAVLTAGEDTTQAGAVTTGTLGGTATTSPTESDRSQEVRPITGAAREVVQRLTRAAGLVVPKTALSRPTATADVARALEHAGKPVTTRILAALEATPNDPSVIEEVTLRLRGSTPQVPARPAGRPVQVSDVSGGPEAVPSPTERPTRAPSGSGRGMLTARTSAAVDRAQAGRPSVQAQGPEALPSPPRPTPVSKATPGKALSATLDDPLPVNWLQAMTEQAVTPLTPRN